MEKGKLDKSISIEENIFKPTKKVVGVDLPVSLQEGDFKLLTLFMANSTARISDKNKWIERDDNLWFVYEQPYGKRVKKLLETDKFVKALALLSD